jgi:glycosyltransferase involved in cell wall biosynthesis
MEQSLEQSLEQLTPITSCTLEVSVVMPCLNEADTLATCIVKAQQALCENKIHGEVIVADNGSTDGSQTIATRLGARLVPVPARGYGNALMGGIAAAQGRFIIMGDADDSYDFADIMPFLTKLREGYDLVMGNRFQGGIKPGAMPPLHQYLGNPLLTGIGRLFFRCPVGDFHCGLRGFKKSSVLKMDLQTTGMEFASEMVVKATLMQMRIAEVPTTLSPDGRSRPPHLRTWRDGWRHLRFLLLYSPRWLFLYPSLFLVLVGLGLGVWIIPGPRTIGRVTLDVHTLLYAVLTILLGFQGVTFSVFSKIFAVSEGLLPEDSRSATVCRFFNLEMGLVIGGALVLCGLAGSVYALSDWSSHSFGSLDPTRTLRMVAPAILALALGGQIILASFFLSVLGLRRKR